jgi:hypothetical protein
MRPGIECGILAPAKWHNLGKTIGGNMHRDQNRKEPTLSDTPQFRHEPGPVYNGLEPETQASMHPLAKLALLAVVLACLAFVADRAWQRYQEYRLLQEIHAIAEGFEQSMRNMADQERARVVQQRRNRAASRDGRWLGKNCADWRRAYQDNPLPTTRTEMQRHCQIYERYLATGIAPVRTN